jgi:hypothetical protein
VDAKGGMLAELGGAVRRMTDVGIVFSGGWFGVWGEGGIGVWKGGGFVEKGDEFALFCGF